LCYRWVERNASFVIRFKLVSFTLFDVCLGLGFRIRGKKVDLKKEAIDSHNRSLFGSICVNLAMIYEELVKRFNDCTVGYLCKLYILFGFPEFL